MFKQRKQSSAAIMLRSMMTMIVVITLALSLLIVIAVGHQLIKEVGTTTEHITRSLSKTDIDGDDDWENWRRNSTLDTSATYVYVHNERKNAQIKHYYSPKADKILKVEPVKVPFIANLYYRHNIGFLYHRMAHARGIYYTLWQSMTPQIDVLLRVIQITAILLILTLLISPLYIQRLTKRLTDPLSDLSRTTKTITKEKEPGSMRLPVPKQPTEVTELASNFNDLLAMLDERQEQQKLFVMNAAHELRTPIATIRSHSQLIERHGDDHPEIIAKSVRYITEESRQMQQLIEELLTLSRADRLVLDVNDLNLSTEVAGIVQKMQGTFKQTITTDIDADVHGVANSNALEQILSNLVTNAAKYSPASSTIAVTLRQAADGGQIISVKDQGRGISDAEKAHVFERFFRSADVRGSVPGTGLGLAIATQLATLLNANLQVADNQPRGTIFSLHLPAVQKQQATEAEQSTAE
ncbi:sensor histidine kinase [Lacticaseibacillus zhaodongensis]|uniref:sensor histidine kinase n=1 Tax=Lacticaseibacillus zhaodongensis TaxID=2668065 RepID=UPI001E28EB4E|nr:HAMP domain-containing sensor histidine kinase [Lacticaseibacillus zhaodongensis]